MKNIITKALLLVVTIATIFTVCAFSASAAENTTTVDDISGVGSFIYIEMNGVQAFCVQSWQHHPSAGYEYKVGEYEHNSAMEPVFVAIQKLDDGTDEFRGIAQCAVWSVLNDKDYTTLVRRACGVEAIEKYNEILELAKTIDMSQFNVDVIYYVPVSEDVQVLCIPVVTEISSDTITEEVPETTPETTVPETDPEETTPPEETTTPETTPEETTPEVEPETTPEETVPEETVPETTPEETEETEEPEEEVEETTPEETIPEDPQPEILGDDPYIPEAPQTGDNGIAMYVVAMLVSIIALIALTKKKRV